MKRIQNNLKRPTPFIFTGGSVLATCSVVVASLAGCAWNEDKKDPWTTGFYDPEPMGLDGSVVLHDRELSRLLFLTSDKQNELSVEAFPVGGNVTSLRRSDDGERLFVLTRGDHPRIDADDEPPRLVVYDGGTEPKVSDTFELDNPMTRLSLDPRGEWVVAFAGDAAVTNPNELVLFELGAEEARPASKTIRSFGGAPEELLFTDELAVPDGAARRFMVVRTDRDITLVDLGDLDQNEITIGLPESQNGVAYEPAQIVFDDGDPEDDTDARLAVRLKHTSDVVLIELGESDDEDKDFSVGINIVDVGGVPSTIDFVRTDGGLRVAALVPGTRQATLINPATTLTETIALPGSFQQMTRITSEVGGAPAEGDVALLWGANQQIAFWSLGSTSATPFRSIDANELNLTITSVMDVPPPNQHLKVLIGQGDSGFYVLDLQKRQSFPLHTDGPGFSVTPSSDGERLWVTKPYSDEFSAVFLRDLHPADLYVEPSVNGVFDIERADGGRSVIALHSGSTWSATVLDANDPKSSVTAYYPVLFWENMQ